MRAFQSDFERSELPGQNVALLNVLRARVGQLAITDAMPSFMAAETGAGLSVGAEVSANHAQVHWISRARELRSGGASLSSTFLRARADRMY